MDFIERTFPVFRTGTHTDAAGRTRTWTGEDLDRMVSSYDPARHEAPVVIGHPKDNSPAFGWVRGLKNSGGTLFARADLIPEFDDMVRRGLFRKRSLSLYEDGTLRHIGFLGARPPAIKGLPDIRFDEGETTTIEFTDSNANNGGVPMKFTEWIRQLAGREGVTLDDLPGSTSVEDMRKRVECEIEEEKKRLAAEFAEARKEKEEALAAREEKLRAAETGARRAALASFSETLEREGVLTPAMMKEGMGMTRFLESIASLTEPVEFAEGDGSSAQTPLEFMQSFLRRLPPAIEFREIATAANDPGVRSDPAKRERLISDYMEAHPDARYREAVIAVASGHPELFEER